MCLVVGWLALAGPAVAQADLDLAALSLEELMDVEVAVLSRAEEPLFRAAAAVAVLTGDDIRRSGATSIPEALRLVPGVQVAHIDANKWAVSARGFADRFAQKLLVLIDGRTVYSPLFSGVFWGIQDLPLAEVERIEVVRGPGATLWGANAVNGIVNIVTRRADDTEGTLVEVAAGTETRGEATLRVTRPVGTAGHLRVYARAVRRDAFAAADGGAADDDTDLNSLGFRLDGGSGDDRWTVLGTAFAGDLGQVARFPQTGTVELLRVRDRTEGQGGHLLARWERAPTAAAQTRLQVYHDRNHRLDTTGDADRSTWDLDLQHRVQWNGRHESVAGIGLRTAYDQMAGGPEKLRFDPEERRTQLYSAFVHHQVDLVPERLRLALGSKVEHNAFSGGEVQPGVRLLWQPAPAHAVWAAATRAVRTPARADHDVDLLFRSFHSDDVIPGELTESAPNILQTRIVGDDALDSEVVRAIEAGYRLRPTPALLIDVAAFRNRYTDLRGARPEFPVLTETDGVAHFLQIQRVGNVMSGTAYGAELFAEWQLPARRGRLRAGYAWLHTDLEVKPGAARESLDAERTTPTHQAHLWPSLNLGPRVHLDAVLRYMGAIDNRADDDTRAYVAQLPQRDIAAYLELDLRLAWQARPDWRVALVGRNLLHDDHAEFVDFFLDTEPTRPQRSLGLRLTWTP